MFERVAIVNRGEPAVRLIHAVRELSAETGHHIEVVALHVEAESNARFVLEADVAFDLGPAAARPYLNHALLERALRQTRADAAWVGWGFVAEDPTFADLCERIGVTFVGPSGAAMRRLGDKIGSKLIAEEAGVPVAPWSRGPVESLEQARADADRIGYPLMLKATAGGGGRGIRKIGRAQDLDEVYQLTRDEAERAFGSGVVFLESMVTGARHVEVQVIADGQGTAWALGVRDCSVQRRNQKVIEESSSPVLPAQARQVLMDSAERLALTVDYRGAATVEFLYEPGEEVLAFLEVNTRLQVEHPITEIVTGFDLVKAQLAIAAGQPLTGERPVEVGHAIEARLNAEDPDRDFAPAPGRVALLDLPTGPGIRVDTGLAEGDTIPADFDSMIAKIMGFGRTRQEALARLQRALSDTHVVLEGGATNKSFILHLLDQPEVLDGSADTGWIDRVRGEGRLLQDVHGDIALVAAAIAVYDVDERTGQQHFRATAAGGRPHARHTPERVFDLKLRGAVQRAAISQVAPDRFRVVLPGLVDEPRDAVIERIDDYSARLTVGGFPYRVLIAMHGPTLYVEVDDTTHRISQDEGGVVRATAPALVVAVPVQVQDAVEAGTPVVVLESMKMETALPAPSAGHIREILVGVGQQVEAGAPLIRLEPSDEEPTDSGAATAVVRELSPGLAAAPDRDPEQQAVAALEDLRGLILGFDLTGDQEKRALADYTRAREQVGPGSAILAAEQRLLLDFATITELSRNRPDDTDYDERVHSPREHFHSYLQTLDPARAGLPQTFHDKLLAALQIYGVDDLEVTPALEEAVFRIFLALQGLGGHLNAVSTVLLSWMADPDPPAGLDQEQLRTTLDNVVAAAQVRHPRIGDLARSVRFAWFEEPVFLAQRQQALDEARAALHTLVADPDRQDRAEIISRLATIPEQIVDFLTERLLDGVPTDEPMLEVLIRRHYQEHDLGEVSVGTDSGYPVAQADYSIDSRDCRVVSTEGEIEDLVPGGRLDGVLDRLVGQADAASKDIAVDLYLSWPDLPEDIDDVVPLAQARLSGLDFPRKARRTMLGLVTAGRPVVYVTFRPERDSIEVPDPTASVVEDDLIRGVHPMVGRRLDLWRLRNFTVQRLDAPQDVFLYHCVAPENPADQRLVVMAQIRQAHVVRDGDGKVVGVPHVQRAVSSCSDAIRRARAAMGASGDRMDFNHLWLHVWPVVDATVTEITALGPTIRPLTTGRGIQEVVAHGRVRMPDGSTPRAAIRFTYVSGKGVIAKVSGPARQRLKPLDSYGQKVLQSRRRGTVYPYELVSDVAGAGGGFVEYDLDDTGALVPVSREPGLNTAGIVVGTVSTPTERHPEGVKRVVLFGDPTKALGSVAGPECDRVVAALDLAEREAVPVEWFALSSGARISMTSGTENMDGVARGLRRIIEFTQAGGEINVVVAGINVGAQPYWNAEATMLMHTRGVLIMTPDSAMVLTGKQSLDFSGGVSAEDNFGIGGYDRVMGPNGQAQYWAADLTSACRLLHAHYAYTYVVPGEQGPRRAVTTDPVDRDVRDYPHTSPDSPFTTVGEIFSATTNPDRKKPFDIRTLMRAICDEDHPVLERWADMADADTSVVFDATLGGYPVTMIGIESRPVPRRGSPPADGPDQLTAGTLFPRASKKTARGINAASGNRPVVVIANLSGFDGSPESMRNLQLEYGAEIGRAVVNFRGPIIFCVVSRYHGGAFVVFSKQLHDNMRVLAVEGSYASVIGGAPAAAVVFAGEVRARTAADPRVRELDATARRATGPRQAALLDELASLTETVRTEKLGEVATEFDNVHDIDRAVAVGSVDEVISAADLRPTLVTEIENGLARAART